MTEDERKRLIDLAKEGKLLDADGKKINIFHPSLRPPKQEPTPAQQKSEIVQAVELMASTMASSVTAAQQLNTESGMQQASVIIAALQQNKDVLEAVKVALEIKPDERKMEEWVFNFSRDNRGIVGATATQVS